MLWLCSDRSLMLLSDTFGRIHFIIKALKFFINLRKVGNYVIPHHFLTLLIELGFFRMQLLFSRLKEYFVNCFLSMFEPICLGPKYSLFPPSVVYPF